MQAPVLYPATMEVPFDDFSAIPEARCSPALDGLFVSHAGALDLVRGVRRIERDYQIKLIDADSNVRICRTQLEASQQELTEQAAQRAWGTIGKLSVAGIGTAVVVTAIVLVAKALGDKNGN